MVLAAVKEEDNVNTVTIAGMGGPLIVSILEKHPESLKHVTRLILQPNIHAKVIREWAMRNGWAIQDEVILEEDGKIYEVLVLTTRRNEANRSRNITWTKAN